MEAIKESAVATGLREVAIQNLSRLKPASMKGSELNLAAGLLLGLDVLDKGGELVCEFTGADGQKVTFEPVSNWEHYGHLVSNKTFVTASHGMRDDPDEPEKVTGHWYSAHSFFSGTETEGYDLRRVVLVCAAKRLEHEVKYPPGA